MRYKFSATPTTRMLFLFASMMLGVAAHADCNNTNTATQITNCSINLPDVRKQAEKGDRKAQFELGLAYEKGRGVSKDETLAAMWYKKSANQGNLDSMHNLSKLYLDGRGVAKNETEAFKLEKFAAEKGNAYAQNGLGLYYLRRQSLTRDINEAIKWLNKAAAQGMPDALVNLGKLYERGDGVAVDYTEAFFWYQKSAITGNAEAQFSLCNLYRHGLGAKKNIQAAYDWCSKSADSGNVQAQVTAGGFAYGVSPELVPDYPKAIHWWSQAANKGYADAQFLMGMAYDSGKAVPKNSEEARRWYELAAKQGNPQAISRLKSNR